MVGILKTENQGKNNGTLNQENLIKIDHSFLFFFFGINQNSTLIARTPAAGVVPKKVKMCWHSGTLCPHDLPKHFYLTMSSSS